MTTDVVQSNGEEADDRSARLRRRLALAAILSLAALLRLWRLDLNGFGTEYYTAGVRSMSAGWHNFLFNAFDPAGFVSLDKPPVAFWVQVVSAKILGFSAFSVMLPQVLEGVGAVLIMHHLVGRQFGSPAGLLAALFLALTPISVAVDRSSNTDSCLVLVLLLAAWALVRATETGSRRRLVLAMTLVGVAFNVKMLAAWVVVPIFAATYAATAPLSLRRRATDLALSGVVLLSVSLAWVVAFDLTPPEDRPFAGSTVGNSMIELVTGHNGLSRFVRAPRAPDRPSTATRPPLPTAPVLPFDTVPTGPLRLADHHLAGQVMWLLPLALAGLIAGFASGRRWPLSSGQADLVLWGGWALTYGVVCSAAGGIFHAYYLVTLAPPLAALAGIGVAALWSFRHHGGWLRMLFPAGLVVTAAWQAYIGAASLSTDLADWRSWLCLVLIGGAAIAAIGSAVPAHGCLPRLALATGVIALLAMPTAWALSTVLARGNVVLPSASLARFVPPERDGPPRRAAGGTVLQDPKLRDFLAAHRTGERYLLATSNARLAAPIIVRTGEPVIAIGGYMGTDPIVTIDDLTRMVAEGDVRFFLVGGPAGFGVGPAGIDRARTMLTWLRTNGKAVDSVLWRAAPPVLPPPDSPLRRIPRLELYDMKPGPYLARSG